MTYTAAAKPSASGKTSTALRSFMWSLSTTTGSFRDGRSRSFRMSRAGTFPIPLGRPRAQWNGTDRLKNYGVQRACHSLSTARRSDCCGCGCLD
jgi:hypothetical protein